ncbi:homeodomain-interacting protein kinase 3-like [Takifugu flavidus]|uniref:homeodomain-interacting protein kinase 3-like n=1 Tax=Takifugu flavidus TaxID=433684 RepID=UPI0025446333|nr:homeodomain-interacting protein kinase 3-like [Takifugu flavidus]
MREVTTLNKLQKLDIDKCNIVRFYTTFTDRGFNCLVFEHLDRSLYGFVKQRPFHHLLLKAISMIVQQLAAPLETLKSIGAMHCDISLPNMMLVNHEKEPFRVKLIDFGLAHEVSYVPQGSTIQKCNYRAPEVMLGLPLTEAIDMWSLGCLAVRLYLGVRLKITKLNKSCAGSREGEISSLDDLKQDLKEGGEKRDILLFVNILKKMLQLDPAGRLTPSEALKHKFVTLLFPLCTSGQSWDESRCAYPAPSTGKTNTVSPQPSPESMAVTRPKSDRKRQLENKVTGEISQASKRAKLSAHATSAVVLSKKDHIGGSNSKRVEHHLPFDAVSTKNVGGKRKNAHDEEGSIDDRSDQEKKRKRFSMTAKDK